MTKIKIIPIRKVTADEIMSAERCLVDNDAGVVIFWE